MCDLVNLDYIEQHFNRLTDVHNVLEVGSFNINGNCKKFIGGKGLNYLGIDIREGPDVNLVCDITRDIQYIYNTLAHNNFDLVICMNVLEHLYEPIKALDNMKQLLRKGGYLIIVTPLVWDLHDWPSDFYRLNPDFFKRYAHDNNLEILDGTFLFSIRENRHFYSNIKILPMIIPHLYKQTAAKEDFYGIISNVEGLWAELVKNQFMDNNGILREKFMTLQGEHQLTLSLEYECRRKEIYAVLQKARAGVILAYVSQFAPELRECWPHIYMNLICKTQ